MKWRFSVLMLLGVLLLAGCAQKGTICKEPPALIISCGENTVPGLLGTYSWNYSNGDGTMTGVEADSVQALYAKEWMEPLYLTAEDSGEPAALLTFDTAPDSIEVQCWSTDCWESSNAPGETAAVSQEDDGFSVTVAEDTVYEIIARWEEEASWGGTAYYGFYTAARP